MCTHERFTKDQVATTLRVMELPPCSLVVAEVREPSCLNVKSVRPISIGATCVEGNDRDPAADEFLVAKTTLVPYGKEPGEGVVNDVANRSATVGGFKDKVRRFQFIKGVLHHRRQGR